MNNANNVRDFAKHCFQTLVLPVKGLFAYNLCTHTSHRIHEPEISAQDYSVQYVPLKPHFYKVKLRYTGVYNFLLLI